MPAQSRRNEKVPAVHSDPFIFRNTQKAILKQEREKITKFIENFHDKGYITVFDLLELLLFTIFANICRL